MRKNVMSGTRVSNTKIQQQTHRCKRNQFKKSKRRRKLTKEMKRRSKHG